MAVALLCTLNPAQAQINVGIAAPGISMGIYVPVYPQMMQVPGCRSTLVDVGLRCANPTYRASVICDVFACNIRLQPARRMRK